jgi:hypothetical protein
MKVSGKWLLCDDGVTRPAVEVHVYGVDGNPLHEIFLVDSLADRTVLTATLLTKLRLPTHSLGQGFALVGIGGQQQAIVVSTKLELVRDDGAPISISGDFTAFTDPTATDMSVLGRDVLNNFDVILSWRNREILLLAPNHRYAVTA